MNTKIIANPIKSNLVTKEHKTEQTKINKLELKLSQIELAEIEAYEINESSYKSFLTDEKAQEYIESKDLCSLVQATKEELKSLIIRRPMTKGEKSVSLENEDGKKEVQNDKICVKIFKEIDQLITFQSAKFGKKLFEIFENNGFSEHKKIVRQFTNTQKVEKSVIINIFNGLNLPVLTDKSGKFLLENKTFERGLFIEGNPSVRNLTDFTERMNLAMWELSQAFKSYENAQNFINKVSASDLKKIEAERIKKENLALKLENEKNAKLVQDIPSIVAKMLAQGIESLTAEERELIGQ